MAQPASDNLARRRTDAWDQILRCHEAYVTREGPSKRGWAFERLLVALGPQIPTENGSRPVEAGEVNPNPVTELEILMLVGSPDYYYSAPTGASMWYRYKEEDFNLPFFPKPAEQACIAVLVIDGRGVLVDVAYNKASVFEPIPIAPYHVKAEPVAANEGDGFLGVALDSETWTADGQIYRGTSLVVAQVASGSPAELAGIHVGDVLDEFNGAPVPSNFACVVRRLHAGDKIVLTVHKLGEDSPSSVRKLSVTIGRRPGSAAVVGC